MAIGGDIKVVLTLDDSGFSVKTQKASEQAGALSKVLQESGKSVEGLENQFGSLSKQSGATGQSLASIQKTIDSLANVMVGIGKAFEGFTTQTSKAKSGVDSLKKSADDTRTAMESLKPSLQKAAEGVKQLSDAKKQAAAVSKQADEDTAASRLRALQNEQETNRKIIESRQTAAANLARTEAEMRNRMLANDVESDGIRGRYFGKNAGKAADLNSARDYQNSIAGNNADMIAKEIEKITQEITALQTRNAELQKATALVQEQVVAEEALSRMRKEEAANAGRVARESNKALNDWEKQKAAQRKEENAALDAWEAQRAAHHRDLENLGKQISIQNEKEIAATRESFEKQRLTEEQNALEFRKQREANLANFEYSTRQHMYEQLWGEQAQQEKALEQQRLAAIREQAEERRRAMQAEREQTKAIAEMWKGIAALWASSKIEQAFGASLNAADEYNRVALRVKSAQLGGPQGVADVFAGAEKLRKDNPNLSSADALKVYNAGATGMVTSDRGVLDQVMPRVAEAMTNLKYMFPQQEHNMENFARNIVGVFEATQTTHSPEKMLNLLDNIYKAIVASGGKMTVEDAETLIRRGGLGNAADKSAGYWYDAMAFANQMKVMGGSGGGAGGVSTQGVMERMMEKFISGGTRTTKQGLNNLIDAGLINKADLLAANGGKITRNYNTVPMINADLAKENLYQWGRQATEQVRNFLMNDARGARFFDKGADRHDETAVNHALSRFADQSIGNTNAAEFFKVSGSVEGSERLKRESDAAKNGKGVAETHDEVMKSWGTSVDKFNASLTTLGSTIGDKIMPMVQPLLDMITKLANSMNSFASDNPLATQLTAVAVAAGGVVLAVKGFGSLFGIVGNFTTVIGTMITAFTGAGAASTAAAAATATSGGIMSAVMSPLKNAVGGVSEAWGTMAKNIVSKNAALLESSGGLVTMGGTFKMLGSTIGNVLGFIGKSFMKAIPLVGWLITAWDLTQLILHLEVGGHEISDWIIHLFDQLLTQGQIWWKKFTGIFKTGASDVQNQAEIARLEAKYQAESKAFAGQKKDANGKTQADRDNDAETKRLLARNPVPAPPKSQADAGVAPGFKKGAGGSVGQDSLNAGDMGGKPKRGEEDPFIRSFMEMKAKANIDKMKIDSGITGRPEDLIKQMKEKFIDKWAAGDFDPGHDPKKRPFGDGKGGLNWNAAGKDGKTPMDWVKLAADMEKAHEQAKAMTFINERLASSTSDADAAAERMSQGSAKQTREMQALTRELARAEERMKEGIKLSQEEWAAWSKKKAEALAERARADMNNAAADAAENTKQLKSGRITHDDGTPVEDSEKTAANFDEKISKAQAKYAGLINSAKEQEAELIKQGDTGSDHYKKLVNDRLIAEKTFTENLKAMQKEKEEALLTPVEKLALEWKKTTTEMNQATSNWMNQFEQGVETMLNGGYKNFRQFSQSVRSFMAGMLRDISSMIIKNAIGTPLANMFSGVGSTALKGMGMLGGKGGAADPSSAAAQAAAKAMQQLATGTTAATVAQRANTVATTSNTGATAGNTGATTANSITTGTNTTVTAVNTNATGENTLSTIVSTGWEKLKALFTSSTEMPTQTAAATSVTTLAATMQGAAILITTAAQEIALAAMQVEIKATAAAFANGGIMTSAGPASLPFKAYAKGGIANSPQLALFGEGSMNEAYVPLPDGRSIPVTMTAKGGAQQETDGGTNVIINITVNGDGKGGETTDSTAGKGDASMWNGMAQKLKSVVREELVVQQRPGGILYNK